MAKYHKNTVSVGAEHKLWLSWARHVRNSELFRKAVEDEMRLRECDPNELAAAIEHAQEWGWTVDELIDETRSYEDLIDLLRETEHGDADADDHPADTIQYTNADD